MPLRAEYTLHQSGFSDFLYAPIWEDGNGNSLSVLSAMARLEIDPWAEAARLAALPKDAATEALAALLSRLPRSKGPQDTITIAERLIGLLPRGGTEASASTEGDGPHKSTDGVRLWLVVALLAALIGVVLQWWGA